MGEKISPFPITFFQKYNYFLGSINEEAWEYTLSNVRNNNKPVVIIYNLTMSNCTLSSHYTCEEISHTLQYPQLWLPYSVDLNTFCFSLLNRKCELIAIAQTRVLIEHCSNQIHTILYIMF